MFGVFNVAFLVLLSLLFLFPLYTIYINAFSDETALISSEISLWPKKLSLESFEVIFASQNRIIPSLLLSLSTTFVGTLQAIVVISLFGYAMSRESFPFKTVFMILAVITMIFNGGLVPTFIMMKKLHLINTFYMLIIFHAFNVGYVVFVRNYFMTIPKSFADSARIDGAGDFVIFLRIMLPIAKPMIACVCLFTAVSIWNDWTTALFYNPTYPVIPLQLVLQRVMSKIDEIVATRANLGALGRYIPTEGIKYATVVVVVTPILLTYPFLQRYFIKGSWIGGVKE